jgi:hypothetical protein
MIIGPYKIKKSILWYVAAVIVSLLVSYIAVSTCNFIDDMNKNKDNAMPVIHFIEDRAN